MQGAWIGATHPLTSKLLRSSGSAVAAEVAMSSECAFWSRAMGSGCDVITAIRADCLMLQIDSAGASRHERGSGD